MSSFSTTPGNFESPRNSAAVTRSIMKTLILLVQQIASCSDTEITEYIGGGGVAGSPRLLRSRSGPATLSDVVFEILHEQLSNIVSKLLDATSDRKPSGFSLSLSLPLSLSAQSKDGMDSANEATASEQSPATTAEGALRKDSLLVLRESLALLRAICKNSRCQRYLL